MAQLKSELKELETELRIRQEESASFRLPASSAQAQLQANLIQECTGFECVGKTYIIVFPPRRHWFEPWLTFIEIDSVAVQPKQYFTATGHKVLSGCIDLSDGSRERTIILHVVLKHSWLHVAVDFSSCINKAATMTTPQSLRVRDANFKLQCKVAMRSRDSIIQSQIDSMTTSARVKFTGFGFRIYVPRKVWFLPYTHEIFVANVPVPSSAKEDDKDDVLDVRIPSGERSTYFNVSCRFGLGNLHLPNLVDFGLFRNPLAS